MHLPGASMPNKYNEALPNCAILWCITGICNFDCTYCVVVDREQRIKEVVSGIDIDACVRTINNTNKTCNVFLTGGEPFLVPRLIDLCKALTERHFISIASNLSQPCVTDFALEINPKRVLIIIASFHGEELMRHNAYGTFVANFHKLKDRGIHIEAMEVAYPGLISKVQYYRDLLRKDGIRLAFSPFIGTYAGKRYPAEYTSREIKIFGFKEKRFNEYYPNNMHCNAGYNAFSIFATGEVTPCFDRYNERLGTVTTAIKLRSDIIRCNKMKCGCVIPKYFPEIYCKALIETRRYHLWFFVLLMHRIISLLRSIKRILKV
jgi:MoaA/NifB/PqqE/SkfB family radical SAM enzyme